MGRFRDAMTRDMLLREFAPSTVKTYLGGARGLVAFYRRPPDVLTNEDILRYAEHLRENGLSRATRAVYHASIRFLYRVTLRQPEVVEGLASPRCFKRKARVLKGSEVRRLWNGITDAKYRALFCVTYGCGLRVSEACSLLTADVDSARDRLLVRSAKNLMSILISLGRPTPPTSSSSAWISTCSSFSSGIPTRERHSTMSR